MTVYVDSVLTGGARRYRKIESPDSAHVTISVYRNDQNNLNQVFLYMVIFDYLDEPVFSLFDQFTSVNEARQRAERLLKTNDFVEFSWMELVTK